MSYRVLPALRPLVLRGVSVAIAVRLAVAVSMAVTSSGGGTSFRLPLITTLAYAGLCGLVMVIDAARRRELVLFANLGVGGGTVAACAVVPAMAIEAAIALVVSR